MDVSLLAGGKTTVSTGRVDAKIALVTGGGLGVGRATAILLASEGATVIVSDIDAHAAEQVASEICDGGGVAEAVKLDVAEESAWMVVIEGILTRHQRIDVLVNNAGVSFAKPIAETTLDEWRRVLGVNLDGLFLGTKNAILAMRSRGGGSIINVASVSGINAYPEASAYGASKAAVRLFSKIAAIECANTKTAIRVNLVTPGGVKTPMWESMDFFRDLVSQHGGTEQAFAAMAGTSPSNQFSSPEDIARTILYFASDESAHLTGVELVIAQGHVG
jgi:3(or 17)beta-hydroxysteroid dehydrogenase